jgi:EAL domain-containing protein (putative c-di-GMP-specific phosphodiesterase class I)
VVAFTIANGFCGVAALFWAMKFLATGTRVHLYMAALFVPLALVFDVLDGRIARWRHKSSPMGRELDSLADVISFGVAPAGIGFAAGLHSALDQLILHVQMQTDRTRRIVGGEILLRWEHPQRGLVSPAMFIPLAEESGLIVPIGLWVLEAACAKLKTWAPQRHTRELQLAVNISARQFRQPDFVTQVRRVVELTGADPARLTLELTESVLLDNIEDTIEVMQALKSLGVRFSMDDFGTGYSSLSYLRRLPLDQLKIDRSFVLDVDTDPNDAVIVQTIIGMAKNLRLDVLAEGVETEEQLEFLSRHGCFAFQGFLFGPPLPVADFEQLLTHQGP